MTSPSLYQQKKRRLSKLTALLGLLLAALLLSACGEAPNALWLNAPDWSRARLVGQTAVGDPPIFALSPQHEAVFLLVANQEGRSSPRVVFLDSDGNERWHRDYPQINMARPDQPRAYWANQRIQLFWISNESLYHAEIEPQTGDLTLEPQKLSQDLRVSDYAVAIDQQGQMVVWFAGPRIQPGLYRFPQNDLSATPMLIDEAGIRPSLAFDTSGQLHALWAIYPMGQPDVIIRHAGDALDGPKAAAITTVATPKAAVGSVFSGPVMGLSSDRLYVFWSIEIRTGIAAGSVDSRFVNFPLGAPQQISPPEQLFIPGDYHLSYEDWLQDGFRAGRRAALQPPRTGKITQIYAHGADLTELVTVQRELVQFTMRDSAFQIGALYFDQGQPESYQLLSFTGGDSRAPVINSDADHYLYVAWHERGAEGFRTFYASTHPDIKQMYARLSSQDYQALTAQTLFGLVSGALLLPFAFMWMIAPLVVFLLSFPLRSGSQELYTRGNIASLALSILSYWLVKLGFLGGINSYVPFSAWLPIIPPWLGLPLQIGVPLVITGLALWSAWYITTKRQQPSPLFFLIIYLAVDSVLSTAIYGPLIFATN